MDPRGNKQEDISFSACPQLLVTEQPPQPSPDMWGIPRGTEGRREEEVGGAQWDPRSSSYRLAQIAGSQASEDGGCPWWAVNSSAAPGSSYLVHSSAQQMP